MILGYKKPENAIANHVESEDKTTTLIQGTGSNYKPKSVIINESGLYSLMLGSKLPTARELQSIRRKHQNDPKFNFLGTDYAKRIVREADHQNY